MDILTALTLTLIASVESNGGQNTRHAQVRSLASIHSGDTAIGRYGFMPKTLKMLKTADEGVAALRYIKKLSNFHHIGARRCPLETLIAWEQGPHWKRAGKNTVKRSIRAKAALQEAGVTSPLWMALREACGDPVLFIWAGLRLHETIRGGSPHPRLL